MARFSMSVGQLNQLLITLAAVNTSQPAFASLNKDLNLTDKNISMTMGEFQKLAAMSQSSATAMVSSMAQVSAASNAMFANLQKLNTTAYAKMGELWPQTAVNRNRIAAETGALAEQQKQVKSITQEYGRMADYVKRAIVAFAAFKALDIASGIVTGSIEAAKNLENFSNALNAALPAGETFNTTMTAMANVTRGIIPQWEQMRMATQLYASGLADTSDEAAKLANAGVIMTTVFKGQNATWDRYFRLLQGGSKMLYDNFNLSKAMVDVKTQEIQATEGLSLSEARLKAVRELVLAQADKFKDSLGELTTASMQLDSAWQDYLATMGQLGPWAEAQRGATGFLKFLMDTRKALDDFTASSDRKTRESKESFLAFLGFPTQVSAEKYLKGYTLAMVDSARVVDKELSGMVNPKPWYDYAQVAITSIDSIESRVTRWKPLNFNVFGDEELSDVFGNWSESIGKFAEDTRDALEETKENYQDFTMDIADYFIDLADLQDDYKDKQSDTWEDINKAEEDAGEDRVKASEDLGEKLQKLEEERVDKIKWVRDGAWKRTSDDEASAEAWWNAKYNRERELIVHKYSEQMAAINKAEDEKKAAANKAAAEETAEFEKHFRDMKLMAALRILEYNNLLLGLTGGGAETAEDTKRLIDAQLISTSPSSQLMQYVAAASEKLTEAQGGIDESLEETKTNVDNALSNNIVTNINPAILSMGGTFTTMTGGISTDAATIESSLYEVNMRLDTVQTQMGRLGPEFKKQTSFSLLYLGQMKTALTTKLIDVLEASRLKTLDATDAIDMMYVNTETPLDKLKTNLEEVQGALKDIETQAGTAGTAILSLTTSTGVPVSAPVRTPTVGQGRANGGVFVVPPGYPNDSYPMLVESGEVVSVIPRNKVQGFAGGTGAGELAPIDQKITNMWLPVVQAQFRKKLTKMFDMEPITEYFTELRDAQAQAAEDEQEYQDVIAGIQSDSLADLKDERKDYNEKVTASETERQDKIKALEADAWGMTQEQYALELAAINATYNEKKKVMVAAYKEQVAIIKAAEAEKLAEEQAAYQKTREEYEDNLKHMKLVASLSVLEMSGTLESFTNGWADTADEAASLIETGLLPISKKFAGALSTSMQGLVGTAEQADVALTKNQKILDNLMGGKYTAMAAPSAGLSSLVVPFTGGTAEDSLKNTIGSIIASMTGDVKSFLEYFGVKDIDKMLGHFMSGGPLDTWKDLVAYASPGVVAPYRPGGRPTWGFAQGTDFIVPPGYARDSFPMYVSSGEHVQVTPQGQNSRSTTINVTGNWNPQSEGDLMRYLKIINLMG